MVRCCSSLGSRTARNGGALNTPVALEEEALNGDLGGTSPAAAEEVNPALALKESLNGDSAGVASPGSAEEDILDPALVMTPLKNGDSKLVFARKGDAAHLLGCDSCVSALDDARACLLPVPCRGVEAALAAKAAATSCRKIKRQETPAIQHTEPGSASCTRASATASTGSPRFHAGVCHPAPRVLAFRKPLPISLFLPPGMMVGTHILLLLGLAWRGAGAAVVERRGGCLPFLRRLAAAE